MFEQRFLPKFKRLTIIRTGGLFACVKITFCFARVRLWFCIKMGSRITGMMCGLFKFN